MESKMDLRNEIINVVMNVETEEELKFTLSGVDVSIVNALRRTILSNIPCIVFETYPEENNKCTIIKNTTKLNNEILNQRLSCIPIHITDLSFPLKQYKVVVNKTNESDTIIYVTTEDFQLYDIKNDLFVSHGDVLKIFPPDPLTKRYIDVVRLKPKIPNCSPGETLHFECAFSISNASSNGSFNCVSTCSYSNTIDTKKMQTQFTQFCQDLRKKELTKEEIEISEKNWKLLDAQRYYLENSFDCIVETVGVFKNKDIVKAACQVIKNDLRRIIDMSDSNKQYQIEIKHSVSTLENSFDIILENNDYTIGKVLEYMFYQNLFNEGKKISFCGFRKDHPHDTFSIVRVAYLIQVDQTTVFNDVINMVDKAILIFTKIESKFI